MYDPQNALKLKLRQHSCQCKVLKSKLALQHLRVFGRESMVSQLYEFAPSKWKERTSFTVLILLAVGQLKHDVLSNLLKRHHFWPFSNF